MQVATIVGLLNPAAQQAQSNITGVQQQEAGNGNVFAQLLSEAQATLAAAPAPVQASRQTVVPLASGALMAPSLPGGGAEDSAAWAQRMAHTITPEQAAAALAAMGDQDDGTALIKELKSALLAIQRGDRHETVGTLTAKLYATLPIKKSDDAIAPYLMQLIKPQPMAEQALVLPKPGRDEHDIDAATQSLAASFFRPVEPIAPAPEEAQPEVSPTSTDDVAALTDTVLPPEQLPMPVSVPVVVAANVPTAPQPLDTRIPPMALEIKSSSSDRVSPAVQAFDDSKLPEVTLPQAVAANDNQPTVKSPAAQAFANFLNQVPQATTDASALPPETLPMRDDLSAPQPSTRTSTKEATVSTAATATESLQTAATQAVAPSHSVSVATASAHKPASEPLPEPQPGSDAISGTNSITPTTVAPSETVRHSAPIATATPHAVHAPVPEQVHVAIARATQDGTKELTIQLDPAELGRVEVKMHTTSDGQTQISFMIDKPSTLDSLARNAYGLERSLQEAGVRTDTGSMQFNLRQQPQTSDAGTGSSHHQQQASSALVEEVGTSIATAAPAISAAAVRNYTLTMHEGLDIRA